MRKSVEDIEQQRADLRKRYKHGPRARRELIAWDLLTEVEKATKLEAACFLKAGGYSHTYIGEALGTTRGTVKQWFALPGMHDRVAEIQQDYIDGAVKLIKTYAIELFEMLVNIARDSDDDRIRIQAITEALDRMGLAKVNKSESAATVTKRNEVDLTDRSGIMAAMKEAPPEVQQEMAAKMDEVMAMAAEHTDKDVTHAKS